MQRLWHMLTLAVQEKNIHPGDLVLEIGGGHNPRARADVLCDVAIEDDSERGGSIVADRPIVEADGQYLPFRDSCFDYVICCHVLEHVREPALFITELMRVASRGYIETPSEVGERLYGWPFHRNYVNLIGGRLVIQEKADEDHFGLLFHTLAVRDSDFAKFSMRWRDLFTVAYEWEGTIDYRIFDAGASPLDLTSAEIVEGMLTRNTSTSSWRSFTSLLVRSLPRGLIMKGKGQVVKQRRQRSDILREIVVCPTCKGSVRWETSEIRCDRCDVDYPVIRGIPRLRPRPSGSSSCFSTPQGRR